MLRKKALKATAAILKHTPGSGTSQNHSALYSTVLNALEDAYLQGRNDQALNRSFGLDNYGHLIVTFDEPA